MLLISLILQNLNNGRRTLVRKLIFAVLLMGLIGTFAFAGSTSGYLYVYANLLPNVSVSATSLNFGDFVPSDYEKTATATISVGASAGTVFHVTLDKGQNFDGSYRRVTNYYGDYVRYWIYNPDYYYWGDNDYANTYPWGGSVGGTSTGPLTNITATGYLYAADANGSMTYGGFYDYVVMTVYY
jgi:spore coat protein U-like protein